MTAIRTANTAVLVVDLNSFLASGALVCHLLRLQGLSHRPENRAADGRVGYVTASGKGITALYAAPDGRIRPPDPVSSTLGAVVQRPGLLFHIRN